MVRKNNGNSLRVLLTLVLVAGLLPALPQRAEAGLLGSSVAFNSESSVAVSNEVGTDVELKGFIDVDEKDSDECTITLYFNLDAGCPAFDLTFSGGTLTSFTSATGPAWTKYEGSFDEYLTGGAVTIDSGNPKVLHFASMDTEVGGFSGCATYSLTYTSTTTVPTVTTADIIYPNPFTGPAATMGGNVTSDGGATVTDRGVIYSAYIEPVYGELGTVKDDNGTGAGSFSESVNVTEPNTTYYVKAYATNSVGTAYGTAKTFTTGAFAPQAPVIDTATAGIGEATVSFYPNGDGGSAVTGYTVTSNPGGFTGTGVTSPITVTGLANGGTYTFTVTATNAVGTSAASEASSAVTLPDVPGAPTIGTATAADGEASVTFSAPASNGGSAITGYTVTSSPGGFTGTGLASPITVSGLTNGTAYTFTVTATNAVGTSTASGASNSVTPKKEQVITFTAEASYDFGTSPTLTATSDSGLTVSFSSSTTSVCTVTSGGALTFVSAGTGTIDADQAGNAEYKAAPTVSQTFTVNAVAPGAPTAVTATAGDGQASVAFTAPVFTGGEAITGYTVTSSPDGKWATGTASPITVTGLTNGTSYTFTVTATNSAGEGAASAASNAVTPKGAQTITFNNPGAQNFGTTPTLSATASSGLTVTFSSANTEVCEITEGGALTFKTAGTAIIVAHQAGNDVYAPAADVTQNFTVNAVVPGAPTEVAATAGDEEASVAFTAPASTGGAAITGYTVTASPGGATGTGTGSPIIVTGLVNGVAYTFTVTATNSAGTGSPSAASNSVTPKAAQTITFTTLDTYNFGTMPTLSATSDSGLTVSFTSSTTEVATITTGGALTFLKPGLVTIVASQAGNASYLPATDVTCSFNVVAVAPGAPTGVTAVGGNALATVSFDAPAFTGGEAINSYTVTANPGGITKTGSASPITVTGLTNGVTYTFSVTATSDAGTGVASTASNAVTPLTVPDAPIIGTATAGNGEATITFTAPASNGGAAITSYTVTSNPHGITKTGTTSPVLVTGLTNGTAYTFTVTATNAAGTSYLSAASNSVTPKAPQSITFTQPGAQNFGTPLTLTASSSSLLPVTFESETTAVCTITPDGVLTFISAGTATITAKQDGNDFFEAATPVSQSFTVNAVVPGAPTIGTATAENGQATINFSAPASNGGTAITSYTVTSSPGGFTGTGAGSPITVTGLANGTAYTFTVTATNSAGTGGASAASNSVTPKGTQTITFANPGAQNFGTTPTLSASATSGLTVTFTSSTPEVCEITAGGALTFLKAGTATINADQAGNGSFQAASTVTRSFAVNAVVPGAPTIGTVTAGDEEASVAFTAPASNGGAAITGYTVTSSPGGFTGTGVTSPITVSGLTNGVAYTFTVTATNSAGTGNASAASNSVTPKAAQTITFNNPGAQNFGTSPTLTATSDSHLEVTFTSDTPDVCTVTAGGTLTFLKAGEATIVASQAGNGSFLPAPDVSRTFTVSAVLPGAPTITSATAGDGQASVSFTPPASNGGVDITSYTVTSSPGGFTGAGTTSPITVTGLTNGTAYTFTVTATNSVGTGTSSAASASATPKNPDDRGPSGVPAGVPVIVNGETQNIGSEETQTVDGNTVRTVSVNDTILEQKLEQEGNGATVEIPISSGADVAVGALNGQTVKNMESKDAVLQIVTPAVTYTLPASEINIDDVSDKIGASVALKDITVKVSIAEPPADTVQIVEDTAGKNSYQLVVKPVEFSITCTAGDKTVEVSKFNGYVERTVAIPEGIDPAKITTGIVLNADGTFTHVPTTIVVIDGKYYAKINSLTNSTYSVIYNPLEFADMTAHWAKNSVNNMGARLVVTGVGAGNYEPDSFITRAQFAAIVVRALGLAPDADGSSFDDVNSGDWYCGYVETAARYGIITGYGNGSFGPNDKITREEAMLMIARAMNITGLDAKLTDGEAAVLLQGFADAADVSGYAGTQVAACLKTGVITGRDGGKIAPDAYITRAEVAVIVERLLEKSGLI